MSEKQTLKLWVMPNAGFLTKPILEQELIRFKQIVPEIELELTVISWSKAWRQLVASLSHRWQDSAPDVVQIGSTWQATLSYLRQLYDLTLDIPTQNWDDFLPPLKSSCKMPGNGQIFSVPWFSDVRVLYYRRDIIEKIGVKPQDFATWTGLRQTLLEVQRAMGDKIYPLCLPGQSEHILIHDLAPWVWSAGGDFVETKSKKSLIEQPPFQKAVHFYLSLINDRFVPLLGRDQITHGNFFSGASAFQISGVWPKQTAFNPQSPDYVPQVAENFAVAPMPSLSTIIPASTFVGASHLAIAPLCKNVSAAKQLISFLTSKENQEIYAKKIGMLPARTSSFGEKFFEKDWDNVGNIFAKSAQNGRTLPSIPVLGSIEQLINKLTAKSLNAIRRQQYNEDFLAEISKKTSQQIDYILSLYA